MLLSPFKVNAFLMLKLPAAFLCGVRVRSIENDSAVTSAPTKWISKNPFGSMYFAVQAMAAELSTGILVMRHIRQAGLPFSMLVTQLQAEYLKRATGKVQFYCKQGDLVMTAVQDSINGEPQLVELLSEGKDTSGEVVSRHRITWSIKAKQPLKS